MRHDRINLLRKLFIEYNIEGYIIPSNDKYMNEYVPEYAKRLEYITGFTGSSGIAIICKDAAFFFTDGRYLEQANKELDLAFYKIYDLKEIYKTLDKNIKIGYDPQLFTYQVLANLNINFHKINENLVDKIWYNKPLEPNSKVYLHDIKFAGVSHNDKIRKCRETILSSSSVTVGCNKNNDDILVILDSASICWLLNLRASDVNYTPLMFAKVILTSTKLYLFINPIRIDTEIINARPEITILPEKEFENILRDSKNRYLIDDSITSVHIMDLIANKKVKKIVEPCLLAKACKNDIEIKHAIDFHIKDAVALCEFFAEFFLYHSSENVNSCFHSHEIITEHSLCLKLTAQRAKQEGYVSDSFHAICGFQENSAIIHYRANPKTAKKIEGHGILLIDSGAQYKGATTDITRTIIVGIPTCEQKKRYTQVLKGHIALTRAKFPKNIVTGANLDILARQYLWQDMIDYPHGTGHGVGSFLSVHEGPQSINLSNKIILKAGMILSNEPGFYIPGKYGIRIENLIYVKENNGWLEFETLSLVPYASKLIDVALLNIDEINYIKEYYNKIRAKIYNLLSTQAKYWLNYEINLFLQSLL
ncbi:aminopeptidase P family protein [Rickettsia prowazekii]|uniref:Xaa-Pro aminopeptidase n=2 Tax=Rickettsia prowazekii TaxID=782 RepID=Q9ZD64_RICPR|nr:aminopeptidase P family protein [Rickettsia prowazekii]AFE49291.1 aminopeptidase P [Rickettsia prowazekii str. Chernikova]AFE50137.1 aminopeptidase P [Rickettsia prowazekii str. Katsinyian]AFE50982.1 aminopeptidase P [Rickettsia prowazekii str. BuV67-CWPP]AFE51818.1 aminopeptidase P [Rickettsia prowazekii str. Dachau]AGJ02355.1 Aminopeptidase P [Rickettsia prowazekii str. Breinl]